MHFLYLLIFVSGISNAMELSPHNSPLMEGKARDFKLDQRDISDLKKFCGNLPALSEFINSDETIEKKEVRNILSSQIAICNRKLKTMRISRCDYLKLFVVNGFLAALLLNSVCGQDDGKTIIAAIGGVGALSSGLICFISERIDMLRLARQREVLERIMNKLPADIA